MSGWTRRCLPLIAALLIGAAGCARPESGTESGTEPEPVAATPTDTPADTASIWDGPPATMTITHRTAGSSIRFQVEVPTGGWKLEADDERVEDGVAIVNATLTRPGPDDVLTMMFETKTLIFMPGVFVDHAELHLRSAVRGTPAVGAYRLAATASNPRTPGPTAPGN